MDSSPAGVTYLLNKLAEGDSEAAGKLLPLIYNELRRIAASRLRHEPPNHTLQTVALAVLR